mgnify:CR=1 FL=1
MIDYKERKKKLVQDISTQESVIKRIDAELANAKAMLSRLEGAVMLCDEFIAEGQVTPATPAEPIAES